MTEQEIIAYWKQNRVEMRAFVKAPADCQSWLMRKTPNIAEMLNEGASWMCADKLTAIKLGDIHTIPTDYQPESPKKQGRWVEYAIDAQGVILDSKGNTAGYFDDYKHFKGIFGGWLWEHGNDEYWSTTLHGVDAQDELTRYASAWQYPLMPKKIRFWVVD